MLHNVSYTYAYFFWILRPTKKKLGHILVCSMINISSMFLAKSWRLETSSRHFYDLIKMTIQQDLAISNGWNIHFQMCFIHLFKKRKHWNLNIYDYWVIGAGCYIKKDLESSPSPPNCSKYYWKLLHFLTSINWPSLVTSWVVVQKIIQKCILTSQICYIIGWLKTQKLEYLESGT